MEEVSLKYVTLEEIKIGLDYLKSLREKGELSPIEKGEYDIGLFHHMEYMMNRGIDPQIVKTDSAFYKIIQLVKEVQEKDVSLSKEKVDCEPPLIKDSEYEEE